MISSIRLGYIGGITPEFAVARDAVEAGITYVNHTFTTHLALAASLVPFAGLAEYRICEYPVQQKPLARDMCTTRIERDANGEIAVPEAPGLGITPSPENMRPYLVDVEIKVDGKLLYRTPASELGRSPAVKSSKYVAHPPHAILRARHEDPGDHRGRVAARARQSGAHPDRHR